MAVEQIQITKEKSVFICVPSKEYNSKEKQKNKWKWKKKSRITYRWRHKSQDREKEIFNKEKGYSFIQHIQFTRIQYAVIIARAAAPTIPSF